MGLYPRGLRSGIISLLALKWKGLYPGGAYNRRGFNVGFYGSLWSGSLPSNCLVLETNSFVLSRFKSRTLEPSLFRLVTRGGGRLRDEPKEPRLYLLWHMLLSSSLCFASSNPQIALLGSCYYAYSYSCVVTISTREAFTLWPADQGRSDHLRTYARSMNTAVKRRACANGYIFWQPRANFPRKNLKENTGNNRCHAKFTKKKLKSS